MIVPPQLSPGDTVALLSASSPLRMENQHFVQKALELLSNWGLLVRDYSEPDISHPYLAGSDRHRAQVFQEAWTDPEVKALFFTRGGYGAARMIQHLNPSSLSERKKIIVGYSDVTTLLLYLQHACGLVVYHGPNIATPRIFDSGFGSVSQQSLYDAVFGPRQCTTHSISILRRGSASGCMVGGNLTLVCASLGTDCELITDSRILFLEDTGKKPYQIDRMLTHLRNAGKLENVRGVVFADMAGCNSDGTLWEVLADLFSDSSYPVVFGLQSGHGESCLTVPLGLWTNIHQDQEHVVTGLTEEEANQAEHSIPRGCRLSE